MVYIYSKSCIFELVDTSKRTGSVHHNVKSCAALDLRNLPCLVDVKGQVEGEGGTHDQFGVQCVQ